jgi:DNA-binding transcriptional ArsR family regulator
MLIKSGRKATGMSIADQAAVFSALGDPTRLRLLRLLCRQRDADALCVNALAALLGVTPSAVSQHLRVLKSIGLVKGERKGYYIHYFVDQDALKRCRKLVSSALSTGKSGDKRLCQDYCPERELGHARRNIDQ